MLDAEYGLCHPVAVPSFAEQRGYAMDSVKDRRPKKDERVVVVHWYLLPPASDIQEGFTNFRKDRAAQYSDDESDWNDGLYQIHADFSGNGLRELLYLGKAHDLKDRLGKHAKQWLQYEWEPRAYVGYIWWVDGDDDYYVEKNPPKGKLGREAYKQLLADVESLLIYSSQPVYNTSNKNTFKKGALSLRVVNTGNYGLLPYETSAYSIEVGLELGSRFKAAANAPSAPTVSDDEG